jgi:hypothetical protein
MMSDKLLIQLEVIPKEMKYPVRVKPDEEEIVREATKQLREKFVVYQHTFSAAKLSDKDLLAMIALDMATSHLRLERKNDTGPYKKKIEQLHNEVSDYLKGQ